MLRTVHTSTKTLVAVLLAVVAAVGLGRLLRADVPVPSNTWVPASDMASVRAGASGTLLADGHVLIAGGFDEHGVTASVERFASAGGSFLEASPMGTPRANHTATLLADGRVLVAGGTGSGGPALGTTEIYDPSASLWLPAGSLNVARRGHTATLLADGRVLIAGGDDNTTSIDAVEIYDPSTGQFSLVEGALSAPRTLHAAAALLDGRVLIAGGYDGANPLASTDIFDLGTGTVSAGPTLSIPRSGLTATTLLDGKVLVAGGAGPSGELASAEIFDPTSNTFTATDNTLAAPRQNHLAVLLPHNNQVLILGGLAGDSPVAGAEYFTPWEGANGTFCAQPICTSGYVGPVAPATARDWAVGSALSFPASETIRSGPADGLLVLAGGSGQKSAELFGFATVRTDQEDYAPGTTVTITGSGWQPREWVTMVLREYPDFDEHPLQMVKADDNGNIISTEFVPDEHDIGIRFYLSAYGAASQAQTTFRDSVTSVTITSPTSGSPVTVTSLPANVTVNFNYVTSTTGTTTATADILGTSATNTKSVAPSASGSDSIVVTIPAGTINGTYNLKVTVTNATGSGATNKNDNLNGAVIVNVPTNTAPTVTLSGANSANEGQTKSYTFSTSDPDAGETFALVNETCGLNGTISNQVFSSVTGAGSFDCAFPDGPTSSTVTVQVSDGDASDAKSIVLAVSNVAPTATLSNDGPVDEGSPATVSFSAQVDPSSVDAAGLHYAYACDNASLGAATYAGSGTSASTTCTYPDDGSKTVRTRIIDKDGGFTEYTTSVTVNNVAPTGTLGNNGPVNEGSPATVSISAQFDPSSTDTAAGFHYAFACSNASLAGATYAGGGTTASTTCTYPDNGPQTVRARIIDKDGGYTEYTTAVTVNNVAPTATFTAPATGSEGSLLNLSLTSASDPSSVDTAAGFEYAFDCGAGYGSFSTSSSTSCTPADSGSLTVKGKVKDKDNGETEYTATVTVTNVAPTGTLSNDGPVNEGSPVTVSFSGQSDPSSADTTAGFHYAYACDNAGLAGASYASSGTSASTTCTYPDNGSQTVRARIIDKDDGYTEYTTSVTVDNVAPTGTLGNNGPVNEGSPATVNFTAPFDPSSPDTAAGFHYAFACDNASLAAATYAGGGTTASTTCTYPDNGPQTVRARIIDKDGGYTEYATAVTVNNVAPSVLASFSSTAVSCGPSSATLNVAFSDPGADTFSASINWGDGSPVQALSTVTSPFNASHTYAAAGPYNATVTITDDDGGNGADNSNAVTVNLTIVSGGILPPIRQDGSSVFKSKSTIPAKVQLQNCDGSSSSSLAPSIRFYQTSSTTPSGIEEIPLSTSAADTTGVMRYTGSPDNQYIYNLAAKQLPDPSAAYLLEITIPLTGQKIYANFGLKP